MTDTKTLIERLHEAAKACEYITGVSALCNEAVAEIAELRAKLAELEAQEPVGTVDMDRDGFLCVTPVHGLQRYDKVYARPVPAIPPGWQLVPMEPFNEALDILKHVRDGKLSNCAAYRDLIAAARTQTADNERDATC